MGARGSFLNPGFRLEVMAGNIPGWSWGQFFSSKFAVTSTSAQLVWQQGQDEYPWLTSATQMQISSSDASDTNINLRIRGLDASGLEVEEILTLNGQNAVTSVNSFFRINDFVRVGGSGSISGVPYLSKAGDTLTAGVPALGNRYSIILLAAEFSTLSSELQSDNTARSPVFSVPAGKSALITSIKITAGEGQELIFWGRTRAEGENFFGNRYPLPVVGTVEAVDSNDPIILPSGVDLCYYAAKVGQNANASIKTSYFLRDNNISGV